MEITLMGYMLIPIGILLFLKKTEYLLYMAIFFSGFTGSSVINFINSDFSFQPSYWFMLLFMFRYIFIVINKQKLVKINPYLFIFLIICSLSLLMPLILKNKDIILMNVDGEISILKFNIQNITQYIYLLFCFITYWFIKDKLYNNPTLIEKSLKVYFFGAFFICIISFYQLIAFQLKLPFDEIFRSGIHGNVQGFRVYSVAGEPSMFAFYVVPTFALLLFSENLVSDLYKKILLVMLFLFGVLSTSSTFLFGSFVFVLIFIKRNLLKFNFTLKNRKQIKKFSIYFSIALLMSILIIVSNDFIREALIEGTIAKLNKSNQSGIERSSAFLMMLQIGTKYPFLGIGFGATRSKDLLSTWIANIGFTGVIVFCIYIITLYTSLNKIGENKKKSELEEGYCYFFVILIFSAFVSVAEPYFLFIWINFAIAEVIIVIYKSQKIEKMK